MTREGSVLTVSPADRERLGRVATLASGGDSAIDELIDALTEPSWVVRRAVVAALADLGTSAVPRLCNVLRAKRDHEGRLAAAVDALVLARGEVDAAVTELAHAKEPAVVCDAVQVLGRRRASGTVPFLATLTADANDNVAVAAIEALGRVGGAAAVDTLLASARSGNFFRTFPAIDVLGRSNDARAIPVLAELTHDPLYAHEAARALGRLGHDGGLEALLAMLAREGESGIRVAALAVIDLYHRVQERSGTFDAVREKLRTIAQPDIVARRLAQAVRGADPAEQVALCRVLGEIGGDAAAECLLDLLGASPVTARAAAAALASAGVKANQRLREELRNGDSARRLVLLPLVVNDAALTETARACLSDAEPEVRTFACEALARIGDRASISALVDALADPDARVSAAALAAIQTIGGDEALRQSLALARSHDPGLRRAGLELVAHFAPTGALPILIAAVADPDERIREAALHALPRFVQPDAVAAVVAATRHESDRTRSAAMRALGSVAETDDVRSALTRGADDPKPWVRYYACQSLGKLRDVHATDVLLERVRDEAGQVRVAAIDALAHLDEPRARNAVCDAAIGSDADVRRAALRGLGAARIESALPILLQSVESADPLTRLVTVGSLARFDDGRAMEALAREARDPDERVRNAAFEGLVSNRSDASSSSLAALLAEPSLRDRVVAELAARRTDASRRLLATAASEHPDSEVRRLAGDASRA